MAILDGLTPRFTDSFDTPVATDFQSVYTYECPDSNDIVVPETELGLPAVGACVADAVAGASEVTETVLGSPNNLACAAEGGAGASVVTETHTVRPFTDRSYWMHPDRQDFVDFVCLFVPDYRQMFFRIRAIILGPKELKTEGVFREGVVINAVHLPYSS